ncbi:MAG TPA: lysine--tRNA ligase [Verrucomicrobiae bacterium]|nr:lysine--tRNA ligase [Verrucomicrobiae bacterium]
MEQQQQPLDSLIVQRKAKLTALREKGIDPFKNKFTPDRSCNDARSKFEAGELTEGTRVSVAGRITAHRDMGKSMFIDVRDQSGRIQVYAQKNALGDEQFSVFTHLDLGDFIGVTGTLFRTKTNEPSIKLESFTILSKALRPPPAKWHGIEDTEIRYRQRYLDLIGNPEVKDVFLKRSAIVREIRNFFHERGYIEVETPTLQSIPGGAAARPFITKYEALSCNFYLRIALELYHKRLLVGGIDKLFEIGKNFRNEGLSRRHNPEFTMLEAYQAFGDYETMMETVESLITTVAQKVLGTTSIKHEKTTEGIRFLRDLTKMVSRMFDLFPESLRCENIDQKTSGLAQLQLSLLELESAIENAREEIFRTSISQAFEKLKTNISTLEDFFTGEGYMAPVSTEEVAIMNELNSLLAAEIPQWKIQVDDLSQPRQIDLTRPWKRVKYRDLVREKVAAKTYNRVSDWFALTPEDRRRIAIDELKMEGDIAKGYEDFEVTGAVFEKLVEPTLIQPTFVTHLPKELVPLAKLTPDDPTTVEVFECCINGQEISPGYTEQNDPIQQRTTLEHQAGGEQQKLDEDFLVALEHGMPPAGGIGIGIDRLCMMLLGQESIRDVILFPQLKPK